ncbi:phage antirepressor KilAC domain-containing protein [Heyndrickxia sp. FSL W8-0496]|uniref:phage antirepressor KilAC domain-containing protein n=1 Tax=Heyndrickxia sp. FSL W8-0496 TaxID=2954702 RepID=UPI0030F94FD2
MKKEVNKNYKFTDVTYKGKKVFIPSEVSRYLNRSDYFATGFCSRKEVILIRSIDYFRLSNEENENLIEENINLQKGKYRKNAMFIRYLYTIEGLKKIHEHSSHDPFPFEEKKIEKIEVEDLRIKKFKGQPVVTLKDIDDVHGRPEGTASRNFRKHKEKYIENEDYFFVKPIDVQNDEIRQSEIHNSGTYLLTESGYLMLVKSFTDDLAWQVQRKLVRTYFNVKQMVSNITYSYMIDDPVERAKAWIKEQEEKKRIETEKLMLEQKVAEFEPKITYYDEILKSTDIVTITQIAKDYGMSGQALNELLHEEGIQYKQSGQWLLYRKYQDKGYTKSDTQKFFRKNGEIGVSLHTKWTQKGRLFIHELLADKGISPLMDQEKSPVLQH